MSVIVVFLADIASRSLTLLLFEPSTTITLASAQLETMSWSACESLKNDNDFFFFSLSVALSLSGCGGVHTAGSESVPINRENQWP